MFTPMKPTAEIATWVALLDKPILAVGIAITLWVAYKLWQRNEALHLEIGVLQENFRKDLVKAHTSHNKDALNVVVQAKTALEQNTAMIHSLMTMLEED